MASTPCAACKLLRRKCTQECVFAPYFPPTQPQKFIYVHKVFGASNVTKILNDLPPPNREDAVNSLYYEAEARIRDPIYGCVGLISFLQQCLKKIQQDLVTAKEELAGYIGPDAVNPQQPYLPPLANNPPPNFMMAMEGIPHGVVPQGEPLIIREPNMPQHQHQPQDEQMQLMGTDAQRMAAMILERGGDQQGMFNGYGIDHNGSVTATGYNQMDVNDHTAGGSLSGPSLALGSFGDAYQMGQETEHHINHDQLQTQLMLQPPLQEGHQEQNEGQFLMQPMGQENLHEEEDEEELEPPVKWRKSDNKEASY